QGCVSPHAIYVEDAATDPRDFARMIADELAALQQALPRADLTSDEAAAIQAARARAEFGGFAGRATELVSPPDAPFTVVFHGSPDFEASCLLRTVHVHRVASVDDALHALQPHRPLLQSAALAGGNASLHRRIAHAGFTRIASFADMAWPDFAGYHDGRGPLRELLRMVSVEQG
ncbi:MAG: acyl-CoA reductase, partial [Longimicrobiales bacterium]